MAPRDHFRSYLDSVRREDRYRTFADLERRATAHPLPFGTTTASQRRTDHELGLLEHHRAGCEAFFRRSEPATGAPKSA